MEWGMGKGMEKDGKGRKGRKEKRAKKRKKGKKSEKRGRNLLGKETVSTVQSIV
jgi:hypothetical protein